MTATLDAVAASTALDEVWITDEAGSACITTVRDETGAPMPFRFDPDPAVQPQASAFHRLLARPPEVNDVVAQQAQVREIDREVYKYVGVNGVDRRRIVQVGSALAFEEQATPEQRLHVARHDRGDGGRSASRSCSTTPSPAGWPRSGSCSRSSSATR